MKTEMNNVIKRIKKPYEPRKRESIICEGVPVTKQSAKDECDINIIMKKYQKTGVITHVKNHSAHYGFANSLDYHDAMNIVTQADQMFKELPSSLRERFGGDPGKFLEFVQNPENVDELRELGLVAAEIPPESDIESKPGDKPPEPPKD